MSETIVVLGCGSRIGMPGFGPIELAVRGAVQDALQASKLDLGDIDLVVSVGSDIMDGAMVATRSGIAGSYSHQIMTVPSSGGHGLAAALAMLESGAVRNVLLVGWGEGTKFAALDSRIIQADPFYARPVGADAIALTALQAQRLTAEKRIVAEDCLRYGDAMRSRAGRPAASTGAAGWLATGWCDGVCAMILAPGERGVAVRDVGTAFEPYCPAPERLDPAEWVKSAFAAMRDGSILKGEALKVLEVGGPTPFCEAAALHGLPIGGDWENAGVSVNASGGGAVAFFGAATGLQRIAAAVEEVRHAPVGSIAGVIDLAGPIGQAVSMIALEVVA